MTITNYHRQKTDHGGFYWIIFNIIWLLCKDNRIYTHIIKEDNQRNKGHMRLDYDKSVASATPSLSILNAQTQVIIYAH
jgi:hypothetical protein